jgi:hypothetical protein
VLELELEQKEEEEFYPDKSGTDESDPQGNQGWPSRRHETLLLT